MRDILHKVKNLIGNGSDMKRFDTRTYSVSDFVEWRDREILDFSPDFQRRYVWSEKAKSYLIDTVVREMPMPKLILSQTLVKSRQVRIVVDGQQRIRTLLEYVDNKFQIKKMHNEEFHGKFYRDLNEDVQQTILKYELGVDVLFDASYEELIEIFARINTYTVKLNPQELRNALYLGYFKQSAFSLGKRYATYWIKSGVLKTGAISRMGEAELSSNLLVVCVDSIQTNSATEGFYKKYEDEEGALPQACALFDQIMSHIGEVYPAGEIKGTIWSGEPLFYSLFSAFRNSISPLVFPEKAAPIVAFDLLDAGRIRVALDSLSAEFTSLEEESFDAKRPGLARFVDISRRRTADLSSRIERTRFISEFIKQTLAI